MENISGSSKISMNVGACTIVFPTLYSRIPAFSHNGELAACDVANTNPGSQTHAREYASPSIVEKSEMHRVSL